MLTHIHPSRVWFACENSSYIKGNGYLSSMSKASPGTAKCPEPLCPPRALPSAARSQAPRQRALPLLHHSYGLMRQTKILSPPTVDALVGESLQVVVSPCWKMALPDVISTICVRALGPLPRSVPLGMFILFPYFIQGHFSQGTSASPSRCEVRHAGRPR
jgi:hypothetical protein